MPSLSIPIGIDHPTGYTWIVRTFHPLGVCEPSIFLWKTGSLDKPHCCELILYRRPSFISAAIPGSENAELLSLFRVVRARTLPPGFPFGNTPAITYQRCSGGGVRNDEAGLASTRTRQMITGPKPPPRFPCLRLPVSIVPISGTRDIATFPRSLLSGSSFPQRAALEKGNRI